MFLQQQLRCKSLHYIQKPFSASMDEDLAPELSGSETEASSEDIKFTLFSAAAREANSRADATFAEMVARSSTSSSSATPAPKSAVGVAMLDGEGLQYALEWNGPNALRPSTWPTFICWARAWMALGTLIYRVRIGCNADSGLLPKLSVIASRTETSE